MKVIRTRSVCLTPTSCPSRGLRSPANLAGLPEAFQTDQTECARTALPLTSLLLPCPPGSMACRPGPPSQDTTHCQASKHTSVPDSPGGFKSTIGALAGLEMLLLASGGPLSPCVPTWPFLGVRTGREGALQSLLMKAPDPVRAFFTLMSSSNLPKTHLPDSITLGLGVSAYEWGADIQSMTCSLWTWSPGAAEDPRQGITAPCDPLCPPGPRLYLGTAPHPALLARNRGPFSLCREHCWPPRQTSGPACYQLA